MTVRSELESAVPDLEALLVEMLSSILHEEVYPGHRMVPTEQLAISRLILHEPGDDTYLGVEVRAETMLARRLAATMLAIADPDTEDVLDAIAELGNIGAGNVKALLCNDARLSLPLPRMESLTEGQMDDGVRVGVSLLGHVLELVVMPLTGPDELTRWPPTIPAGLLAAS